MPLQYSFCSIALFSSINIVVRHNTIRGGWGGGGGTKPCSEKPIGNPISRPVDSLAV